jgi:hypothetical protein
MNWSTRSIVRIVPELAERQARRDAGIGGELDELHP